MVGSLKTNTENKKLRELKSAPKTTWLQKKNSNPSTKEEEVHEEQLEKEEKPKKRWMFKEQIEGEGKSKSKKKYIEKKQEPE